MTHPIIQEDLEFIIDRDLPWAEFYGKTVLITGAGGFLPAYLLATLIRLNDRKLGKPIQVICLVRNRARAEEKLGNFLGRPDVELIVQDICDPIQRNEQIDFIIHAASQASPKYFSVDPVGTLKANVLGTLNLLELARNCNSAGFLYFSSGEIYGESARFPTREDDYGRVNPADVRSCYAEGKRAGETLCVSWHHQYGIPVKIVRPFHTYGPGMRLDDGRVFADFVADIIHGRDIVVAGSGQAIRTFCYLADATAGFLTVLLKGKCGDVYNVSDDQGEISILGLAQLLSSLFPERGIKVVHKTRAPDSGYVESGISRTFPSIDKAKSLGWQPEHRLEEGFRRTIESFL